MSTYTIHNSVCGKSSASVSVKDVSLNSNGIICCDNCESILICRKAWDYLYKEVK